MKEILRDHFYKYPEMQIQDAVKLLFQSEFGPGHLLSNTDYARKLLVDEIELTKDHDSVIEVISNQYVRYYLGHLTQEDVEDVLSAMIESAQIQGSKESFIKKLSDLKEMNLFPVQELDEYLNEYLKRESWMVSHSDVYRACYQPHYRVLLKECAEKLMLKKRGNKDETENRD